MRQMLVDSNEMRPGYTLKLGRKRGVHTESVEPTKRSPRSLFGSELGAVTICDGGLARPS